MQQGIAGLVPKGYLAVVLRILAVCPLSLFSSGCLLQKVDYTARSATAIDPKSTRSDFWFDKPATDSVRARDFNALWNAAESVMREYSFAVDLVDYREGVLTSHELVSKMPFEFWKNDVVTVHSQVECSLSTMRRKVRFQIRQLKDRAYVCEPKVLIQHYAMPERRITAVIEYQDAFSTRRPAINGASEEGDSLPVEYWFAIGRDEPLEHAMADSLRRQLHQVAAK